MSNDITPRENEILFYTSPDGGLHVEVFYQDETFWLSQKRMADLFEVEVPTINYHLKEIYKSGELNEPATITMMPWHKAICRPLPGFISAAEMGLFPGDLFRPLAYSPYWHEVDCRCW